MKKWICKVCGYVHEGKEAPERCPQCGVEKQMFRSESNNYGCAYSMLLLMIAVAALFAIFV